MQEDVGQERADARALRRSFRRVLPFRSFEHAGFEPPANESQDSRVGDAMREHPEQPLVVYRVEEASDVRVEDPVHVLCHKRGVQRLQGLVRTPSGPEAVREAQEVDFVDGAEDLGDRALDDFVLERGDAEWPLSAIRFRDVHAPYREGAVRTAPDPAMQAFQLCIQVLLVRRDGLPIDSCCSLPLQTSKRSGERVDVHMMKQCRELRPLVSRCCLVDAHEIRRHRSPALRPDDGFLVPSCLRPAPSLHTPRFLRRLHRYYGPVRLPTSARLVASGFHRDVSPPATSSADPVGPLGSR